MSSDPRPRRRLSYESYTECWYVPGETHIVDLIHPDDGLTLYAHEDEVAIRARYADARRMTCDEAFAAIDAAALARYRSDITEVTEERFTDALNVLPPVGWTTHRGVESFRISERLWGNLTDIYARLGDRYFKLTDDIRLPAATIAERVHAFIVSNPVAASDAPVRPRTDKPGPTAASEPTPGGDT